jgi:putative ABC transport system permease protein
MTMGLGIGATVAMFSLVYAVLLRPLPYKDPSRLVLLGNADQRSTVFGTTYTDYQDWKATNHTFDDLAIYYRNSGWSQVLLTSGEDRVLVQGGFVSANFFSVMGMSPLVGRVFTADEENSRNPVVVLSFAIWEKQFAASPAAIGNFIDIDSTRFQVIGVMPKSFRFPDENIQFWAPITTNRYWSEHAIADTTHAPGFYLRWNVVGRLKEGTNLRTAQAEMTLVERHVREQETDQPQGPAFNGLVFKVEPVGTKLTASARLALLILLGAVSFVLLIACTNVANLILARGTARGREMAIRRALGATRAALIWQLLTESIVLSTLAGCLGVLLSHFAVKLFVAFAPKGIPRLDEASIDPVVVSFAFGIALLSALLFGAFPAWKSSRSLPNSILKGSGSTLTISRRGKYAGAALVIAEFALSTVLLSGAGLLVRSFLAVYAVDAGFRADHVLTFHVNDRDPDFYKHLLEQIRQLPGVRAAGATSELFELEQPMMNGFRSVEGHEAEPRDHWSSLTWSGVSGDYFQSMGVPLVKGRFFSDSDNAGSMLVAIVDESLARRYWPNEDPLGKHFKGQDPRGKNDDWLTVIGVVKDMRTHGLEREPTPHVYEWAAQSGPTASTPDIVVRTSNDPLALAASVRRAVRSINSRPVITSMATLNQEIDGQLWFRRFQTWLLGLFAAIALVLACLGIYGLMQYSVIQRTREIGIRMALGAETKQVLRMILKQGVMLGVIGLSSGFVGALLLTRFLSSMLFGITPTDPVTFVGISIVLLLSAIAATLIPARCATRVNPLVALRYE